jgi:hypothetical protein
MGLSAPTSAGESRVLRWFLVAFFSVAVLVIGSTWWRKAEACRSTCDAAESSGELVFTGGGRFGASVACRCEPRKASGP